MANTTPEQPTISVTLSISPQTHHQNNPDIPLLTITATLSAPGPITLLTFPNIFNPSLALKRRNFTAIDIATSSSINLEITKGPKRPGFQRRKGHGDEKYYLTLYPGVPVEITHPLNILRRKDRDGECVFGKGGMFRLGVSEGEKVRSWWWGTKDEVLNEKDGTEKEVRIGEEAIEIVAEGVEFELME